MVVAEAVVVVVMQSFCFLTSSCRRFLRRSSSHSSGSPYSRRDCTWFHAQGVPERQRTCHRAVSADEKRPRGHSVLVPPAGVSSRASGQGEKRIEREGGASDEEEKKKKRGLALGEPPAVKVPRGGSLKIAPTLRRLLHLCAKENSDNFALGSSQQINVTCKRFDDSRLISVRSRSDEWKR
eukprot:765521-Hanusia_phi.AAC.8